MIAPLADPNPENNNVAVNVSNTSTVQDVASNQNESTPSLAITNDTIVPPSPSTALFPSFKSSLKEDSVSTIDIMMISTQSVEAQSSFALGNSSLSVSKEPGAICFGSSSLGMDKSDNASGAEDVYSGVSEDVSSRDECPVSASAQRTLRERPVKPSQFSSGGGRRGKANRRGRAYSRAISEVILALLLLIVTTAHSDKTILASDGDTVECVDRNKQIAFKNYLLRNHKIQETPSEYPFKKKVQKKSIWPTSEAQISTAKCGTGTVPVRQKEATSNHQRTPETGTNSTFTPQHEYAEASVHAPPKLYGTRATINLWNPLVEDSATEMSISQIWLSSGDYDTHDLNTIEVGWQVCPGLYNDSKTRFFIYWTSDGYNRTGGYNLEEPGFIQISNSIVLGGSITPISGFGGSQYEMTILVWKDRTSGNWWLSVGANNTIVGYWPREIFTTLADHALAVDWGGEIVDSHRFGRHTKTEMGSGRSPEEGFGKASYFRNLETIDYNNTFQSSQVLHRVAEITHYNISVFPTDDWGTSFFYGGSGSHTHSGVVPLSLSLYLIYLSFSLFFIII